MSDITADPGKICSDSLSDIQENFEYCRSKYDDAGEEVATATLAQGASITSGLVILAQQLRLGLQEIAAAIDAHD